MRLNWSALLLGGCLTSPSDFEQLLADATDADGDGLHPAAGDCDDGDASVFPGADEIWYDGVDQDCLGDDDYDQDLDGYRFPDDCDDLQDDVNPGAEETCNGVDDDCDGAVDEELGQEWFIDRDGDGQGEPGTQVSACLPPDDYVDNDDDCDDYSPIRYTGAEEFCGDGVINDCDAEESSCRLGGGLSLDALGGDYPGAEILGDDSFLGAFGASAVYCGEVLAGTAGRAPGGGVDVGWVYLLDPNAGGQIGVDVEPLALFTGGEGRERNGDRMRCAPSMAGADGPLIAINSQSPSRAVTLLDPSDRGEGGQEERAVRTFASVAGVSAFAFGDLTGDGRGDLVVGRSSRADLDGSVIVLDALEDSGDLESVAAGWIEGADGMGLGYALGVADLNGDGVDELVVGAPSSNAGLGAVLVFESPLLASSSQDADYALTGGDAGDAAGLSISSGGDVDGDGLEDVLVGSPEALRGANATGRAWLLTSAELSASSLLDAHARLDGSQEDGEFAYTLELTDLDGDGQADMVVGARSSHSGAENAGAIHVFYGPAASILNDSDADGVLLGAHDDDRVGERLSVAEDMNGDGLPELLIGVPNLFTQTNRAGALYIANGQGD